jgi:hypothetical protein
MVHHTGLDLSLKKCYLKKGKGNLRQMRAGDTNKKVTTEG